MSTALSEQLLPIDGHEEFTPAIVVTSPARRLGDRTIPLQYEVRSAAGSVVQELERNPLTTRVLCVWKVAISTLSVFVCVVIAGLALVGLVPMLWGWEPVVAMSGSVAPSIQASDVVITAPSDGLGLVEGTVVRYQSDSGLQLGRVVAESADGYLTVGDAELVLITDVRGVGILVVPWIGLPVLWLQQASWLKFALLATAAAGLLFVSRRRWVDPGAEWAIS